VVVATSKRIGLKHEDLLERAEDGRLELSVPRLLRRLNDPNLSEEYKDKLAAVVAPYCSPRLNAVAILKRPAAMTDEELVQLLGATEEDLLRIGVDRDKHKYPYEVPSAER
jgi:hypothetical protein